MSADTLSTYPDNPARREVEGLKFHFLRNSRFSNCGCYRRHRSVLAPFLSTFIIICKARAIMPCLAAKDSPRLGLVK